MSKDTLTRLQVSRDLRRLRASQLIDRVLGPFVPLASPDPALIVGHGVLNNAAVLVIAQEKPHGRDVQRASDVNYGMMSATGYWFVVEILERYGDCDQAVIFLIDTPGADPSGSASDNLLAWSISACIRSLLAFAGPTVSLILGEAGSGGALALQIADRRLMLDDAMYSTIAPESCSAILYRNANCLQQAVDLLRPWAADALQVGIVDTVVALPRGSLGDHALVARTLADHLSGALEAARRIHAKERCRRRAEGYRRIGRQRLPHTARPSTPLAISASPPNLQKFVRLGAADEALGALQNAYFLAKGAMPGEPAELLCARDRGGCGVVFGNKAYEEAFWACPACGRGERLDSAHWIALLCGRRPFVELWPHLDLADLADAGYDTPAYRAARDEARARVGVWESMRVGLGDLGGMRCALAINDFRFFGGTLGAVAGEKIALLCQVAQEENIPLVTVTCSGGVRMHDGILGLSQMAKTAAAVTQLMAADLPYVSILADPSTGGALASYCTLASGILAEPAALVTFAGPRVMRLAGLKVNEETTTGERLAVHGGIDEVVPRCRLRQRTLHCLQMRPRARGRALKTPLARGGAELANEAVACGEALVTRAASILNADPSTPGVAVHQARLVSQLTELALTSLPLLLEHATHSVDARVRANAVESLSRFPKPGSAALHAALTDTHHRVRSGAAAALLRQDPQNRAAAAALQALLESPELQSRRAGLYALTCAPVAQFHDKAVALCGDDDVLVRLAAHLALLALGLDASSEAAVPAILQQAGAKGVRHARQIVQVLPAPAARRLMAWLGDSDF